MALQGFVHSRQAFQHARHGFTGGVNPPEEYKPYHLFVYNGEVYVHGQQLSTMYVYDLNGVFDRSFAITNSLPFCISGDEIFIETAYTFNTTRSISVYDLDGVFQRSFQINSKTSGFYVYNSEIYVGSNFPYTYTTSGGLTFTKNAMRISVYDLDGNPVRDWIAPYYDYTFTGHMYVAGGYVYALRLYTYLSGGHYYLNYYVSKFNLNGVHSSTTLLLSNYEISAYGLRVSGSTYWYMKGTLSGSINSWYITPSISLGQFKPLDFFIYSSEVYYIINNGNALVSPNSVFVAGETTGTLTRSWSTGV